MGTELDESPSTNESAPSQPARGGNGKRSDRSASPLSNHDDSDKLVANTKRQRGTGGQANQSKSSGDISEEESKRAANRNTDMVPEDQPANETAVKNDKVSRCLHVTNLVRPVTKMQLDELLGQAGSLVDDTEISFWLDKKRSHFYCTYETAEQASEAYHIMNGLKFPPVNPRTLSVEYVDESQIRDLIAEANRLDGGQARQRPSTNQIEVSETVRDRPTEKKVEEKTRDKVSAKGLDDLFRKTLAEPPIYWLPRNEVVAKVDISKSDDRERRRASLER